MARNRHTGRYLLPNCNQNFRTLNQVGPGLSRGGISPYFPQLPHLKKASAKFSRVMIAKDK
jgi:hypothetical protein